VFAKVSLVILCLRFALVHSTVTPKQKQLIEEFAAEQVAEEKGKSNSILQDAIDRIKRYMSSK
jgi:hypothetical protein